MAMLSPADGAVERGGVAAGTAADDDDVEVLGRGDHLRVYDRPVEDGLYRGVPNALFAVFVGALVLCVDLLFDLVTERVDGVLALLDLLIGGPAVAVLIRACGERAEAEQGGECASAAARLVLVMAAALPTR